MNSIIQARTIVSLGMLLCMSVACGQTGSTPDASRMNYLLGPGDKIIVSLRDRKEIEIRPAVIGADGTVDLQYTGKIQAAGLSTEQMAREVESKLLRIIQAPKVTVEVSEYGSQPVSILGAVNRPGVQQLKGGRSLIEVLSMAEGLKPEAGNVIKITRLKSSGAIPLKNVEVDATGQFTTAEVSAKGLMDASMPEANIQIRPHDVITVPRAQLVYVLGKVHKSGGFPLAERESITVLQAISLAEGIEPGAQPQNARILRSSGPGSTPVELPVDVKKMLAKAGPDQPLLPNDILFIPSSTTKTVGLRILETGLQMATGVAVLLK